MKQSIVFALAVTAVSHAVALVVPIQEKDRSVSFGALTSADAMLQGSWVSRTADLGTNPEFTTWVDKFTFTMTDNGSFVGSLQSSYLDTDSPRGGSDARIVFANGNPFLNPIRLFDTNLNAYVSDLTISNSSPDFNGVEITFNSLLDDHTYRLEVNGLTNGTKGQAWYDLTAHANYAQPVPEPSTYALLALGLGAVGLMRRSRMRHDD